MSASLATWSLLFHFPFHPFPLLSFATNLHTDHPPLVFNLAKYLINCLPSEVTVAVSIKSTVLRVAIPKEGRPSVTALARTDSNSKLQALPVVREGAAK
jgi:hypothetical protein